MKKVLLIGFVLAILLLAFPQGVMAATTLDSTTAVVSAGVTDYADIIATFNSGGWTLNRSENPLANGINLTVDCSQHWAVTAADADPSNTKGYMDNTNHNHSLATAFAIDTSTVQNAVLTGADLAFVGGNPQPATLSQYDIAQFVTNLDDTAESYDITVAFTLSTL